MSFPLDPPVEGGRGIGAGRVPWPDEFENHGQRVVTGQRLMQASSDIFLGWLRVKQSPVDGQPRDLYGRQLKDWKGSAEIEQMDPERIAIYGKLCGWTLARAHARNGDRIAIASSSATVRSSTAPCSSSAARTQSRTSATTNSSSKRSTPDGSSRKPGCEFGRRRSAPVPTGDVADNDRGVPARRRGAARSRGGGALPPFAEAKLAVPSLRRGVVDRRRVRRALDAGRDAALTLVAAPAGYGKTTAVRSWCADLDASMAWVTLDAGDNDPVRLWRYVATAVDRVRPGLGRAALQRLGVAGGPVEAAVDELMNGVAALGSELFVVLDDLHAVTSEECLSSIDYALARRPRTRTCWSSPRGSGAAARSAACRRGARRGARRRARVHCRRGA